MGVGRSVCADGKGEIYGAWKGGEALYASKDFTEVIGVKHAWRKSQSVKPVMSERSTPKPTVCLWENEPELEWCGDFGYILPFPISITPFVMPDHKRK
ncbi:hypothetical protein AVEN_59695-1 [Araneus ventricosus]|uniref:Uncharacterized protein n=1 Tax=Araneus ventricosus TaxID=182803 RepID=A0A4Y2BMS5_ARAVE|nr:hypothetical protein AVEN_59695-1 [Araneus ventricosus]